MDALGPGKDVLSHCDARVLEQEHGGAKPLLLVWDSNWVDSCCTTRSGAMDTSAEERVLQAECDALLEAVDLFRAFVASDLHSGSGHPGEEGRFSENLLAQFLRRSLPSRLAVGTGFVLDPNRDRRSYQVDILVYDHMTYPHYLQYGEAVVVPWQAVVAAISVKKNLRKADIKNEVRSLSAIGEMCGTSGPAAPYLSIVAFESSVSTKFKKSVLAVFEEMREALPDRSHGYSTNELIDSIIVLGEFLVIKKRWKSRNPDQKRAAVPFLWTAGEERRSLALMHLLNGIERVLYEGLVPGTGRPFHRSFPKIKMALLGTVPIVAEDRPPR